MRKREAKEDDENEVFHKVGLGLESQVLILA